MIPLGVYLVGIAVIAFGVLGFFRGWRREAWLLGGLVLGWSLVLLAGRSLLDAVNRGHLMTNFALEGGFDPGTDASVLLVRLRDHPLISPSSPDLLLLCVLALIAVGSYLLGNRMASGPESVTAQALGVPIGLANGYLIVYALLRFAGPALLGDSVAPTARTVGQAVIPMLLLGAAAVCLLILQRLRLLPSSARAGQPARSRRQ